MLFSLVQFDSCFFFWNGGVFLNRNIKNKNYFSVSMYIQYVFSIGILDY